MKRTSDDESFAVEFGRELKVHYERATEKGVGGPELSDEDFAATLDVTRAALRKYLNGAAMPTLRVIVFAFLRHGISVPYFGTSLFGRKHPKRRPSTAPAQLVLPFSVHGLNATTIQTKIEPVGVNRFEIRVNMRRAG
ncbi:MAG TPA: helix-turn-helix transcriptional regulator [Terracidiphilus sp.]|nr:helix-turn-helix transcriptional regulator [Terracidiphilus sp.]